jgi:hypothetical protein
MQLQVIRVAGFHASVDACAQDEGQIWFLSVLGSQQAVRAIWARLVKGETAYLAEDEFAGGRPCWLAREAWGPWRFYSARLPSGSAHHGMLVPGLAAYAAERHDFLLILRDWMEGPALHYRFLNRRADLPLHASWAEWLWERGRNNGEVEQLECFGVLAYRCRTDFAALQRDITLAIRGRVLAVPDTETAAAAPLS